MPWTSRERDIMGDVYRLIQKNFEPVRDESYWDKLIAQGNEIVIKYGQDPLAMQMVMAVNLYLEGKLQRIEQGVER